MYIGLIDDDLRKNKLGFPNLEIMKLSSYYKNNKDIVELCTDYRNYPRYSKIILRKNLMNNDFPDLFLSKTRDKCEYGGYAFSNGIYVPMKSEIEKSLPDVTIYDKININKKQKAERFRRALGRNFLRLETMDDLPYLPKETCLVYDKAATASPLWPELESQGKIIQFVEHQELDDLEAAIKLANSKTMFNANVIHYKGDIDIYTAKENPGKFKVPIYFDLIPERFKDVSFTTGLAIFQSYFDKVEAIYRFSQGFKIYVPFTNPNLRVLLKEFNVERSESSLDNRYKVILGSDYDILVTQFKSLYNKIKQLRRYHK